MIYALKEGLRIEASRDLDRSFFTCPHCKTEVILKKGLIKLPHFAHKVLSDCESEPESDMHINLKHKIADILGLSSDYIEYSIKNVRCDVYDPSTNTAYEVQCSPLTLEKIQERWSKYQNLGINQVWIFSDEHFRRCYSQYILTKKPISLYFLDDGRFVWYLARKGWKKYYIGDIQEFKSFDDRAFDYYQKTCAICSLRFYTKWDWTKKCLHCWKRSI
ncbi:MAG: competence protein CoiA family protein [Candidatus Omnitrophota bacterium]|jgi:competence CoiA-like predicted nuclease